MSTKIGPRHTNAGLTRRSNARRPRNRPGRKPTHERHATDGVLVTLPLYTDGVAAGKDIGLRLALNALTAERGRQHTAFGLVEPGSLAAAWISYALGPRRGRRSGRLDVQARHRLGPTAAPGIGSARRELTTDPGPSNRLGRRREWRQHLRLLKHLYSHERGVITVGRLLSYLASRRSDLHKSVDADGS